MEDLVIEDLLASFGLDDAQEVSITAGGGFVIRQEGENGGWFCQRLREWFEDPITWEPMCDPVKCNDGRTYDRFTIIDHKMTQSPFTRNSEFGILVDDFDIRIRLFEIFPERESEFHSRRSTYRAKALENSRSCPCEYDAAIEELNNVLKWAPGDKECLVELANVLRSMSGQPSSVDSLPSEIQRHVNTSIAVSVHRDTAQAYEIPVISHDDLIRERYGRQDTALIFVLLYIVSYIFILAYL